MITVYCLIDPRNNFPFYVGITKVNMHTRLSGHMSELKTSNLIYPNNKKEFITALLKEGKRPKIQVLYKAATLKEGSDYETIFYDLLIARGYNFDSEKTIWIC